MKFLFVESFFFMGKLKTLFMTFLRGKNRSNHIYFSQNRVVNRSTPEKLRDVAQLPNCQYIKQSYELINACWERWLRKIGIGWEAPWLGENQTVCSERLKQRGDLWISLILLINIEIRRTGWREKPTPRDRKRTRRSSLFSPVDLAPNNIWTASYKWIEDRKKKIEKTI